MTPIFMKVAVFLVRVTVAEQSKNKQSLCLLGVSGRNITKKTAAGRKILIAKFLNSSILLSFIFKCLKAFIPVGICYLFHDCLKTVRSVNQENTQNPVSKDDLRASEERYRLAIEQTGQIVYDYDFLTQTVKWVGAIEEMTGYLPAEFESVEANDWKQFLHPEDRENAMSYLEESKRTGKRLHSVYRFKRKDGQYRVIEDNGMMFTDQFDKPYRILGTMKDITEQKLAEDRLKSLNADLEHFMYKASHDLKSPIASMRGLLELVKMNLDDQSEIRQYIGLIERSVGQLTETLEALLNVARVKQNRLKINRIDFEQTAQKVLEKLRYQQGFDQVQLNVNVRQQGDFFSDSQLLESVLQNLMENAFKYRRERVQSQILLTIEADSQRALMMVTDNGLGIPANMQEKVFQMFVRASEKPGGTGLGLYIVKTSVEQMKGTIELQSAENQGTTFTIVLPNLVTG
jgi:PAS domain S-box-containing protein